MAILDEIKTQINSDPSPVFVGSPTEIENAKLQQQSLMFNPNLQPVAPTAQPSNDIFSSIGKFLVDTAKGAYQQYGETAGSVGVASPQSQFGGFGAEYAEKMKQKALLEQKKQKAIDDYNDLIKSGKYTTESLNTYKQTLDTGTPDASKLVFKPDKETQNKLNSEVVSIGGKNVLANYDSSSGKYIYQGQDVTNSVEPKRPTPPSPKDYTEISAGQKNADSTGKTQTIILSSGTVVQIAPSYKTKFDASPENAQLTNAGLNVENAMDILKSNPEVYKDLVGLKFGTNTPAGLFKSNVESAVSTLVYATSGKAVTKQEFDRFKQIYSPQLFNTPALAEYKLQNLRNVISLQQQIMSNPNDKEAIDNLKRTIKESIKAQDDYDKAHNTAKKYNAKVK